MFTGVVEVGLFCDMAEAAYFGLEVCHSFSLLDGADEQDGSVMIREHDGAVKTIQEVPEVPLINKQLANVRLQ
jgi:hypothetical protein